MVSLYFAIISGPHKGRNLGVILRLVVTQSSGKAIALIAVAARNVCFWHIADITTRSIDVRFWG